MKFFHMPKEMVPPGEILLAEVALKIFLLVLPFHM